MQAQKSWVFGFCILLLSGCGSKPLPRSQPSPLMNVAMPGFESTTLNGNPLDTSAFYGKPLIVSFVSSDCPACERTLVAAQATYADLHDVVIVGVFSRQDTDRAAPLVSKHQVKFPVVVDPDGAISKRYQVDDVPTTFVGDSQGRVHWVGGSNLTEDTLLAAAESVR